MINIKPEKWKTRNWMNIIVPELNGKKTFKKYRAETKPTLEKLYRNAGSYDEYMAEALNYYDKEEADNVYHELNWKYLH